MGAESAAGIWFMVAAIAFIIMCFLLIFVGLLLLASFNMMRRVRQEMRLYVKGAYHYATLNELLVRILARYERNLAQWYNDSTGRAWEINQRDRNVYETLRKEVQDLKSSLEAEQNRLQ